MQQTTGILGSRSGKTFWAASAVTPATTSPQSSSPSQKSPIRPCQFLDLRGNGNTTGVSWETGTKLPGKSWTLNGAEYLSVERECSLLQILQEKVPEKYYLSRKACEGIIRRSLTRSKPLPDMLRLACEATIQASDQESSSMLAETEAERSPLP